MGRLTLNVLLSFAQFEREVTGERIRDKIAASKAQGHVDGRQPAARLRLPPRAGGRWCVNADEAATVRAIFARYLELGSVSGLEAWLAERGIALEGAHDRDGRPHRRRRLQPRRALLPAAQPPYLGMIVHRDKRPSGHASGDRRGRALRGGAGPASRQPAAAGRAARRARAPLTGRIFDADGRPMSPKLGSASPA